ncbi:hypothetical protein [Nocardia thraciensis]
MMNIYRTAGVFSLFFGFEYRPAQQIHMHPFPLPADRQHASAVMVQQFGQLIKAGIRCWGLGLMLEHSSSVEQPENRQYRLTMTDHGDPAITGLVVDMDGNSYHAVMPRDSPGDVGVHYLPSAGHRRTVLSGDPRVMALESNARALPELWRKHDTSPVHSGIAVHEYQIREERMAD